MDILRVLKKKKEKKEEGEEEGEEEEKKRRSRNLQLSVQSTRSMTFIRAYV